DNGCQARRVVSFKKDLQGSGLDEGFQMRQHFHERCVDSRVAVVHEVRERRWQGSGHHHTGYRLSALKHLRTRGVTLAQNVGELSSIGSAVAARRAEPLADPGAPGTKVLRQRTKVSG
ncbi:MAG: hypothetical protein JSU86_04560, partial [Phycisphaerales bacterium]